jgi:hypothetical protein
VVVSVVVRGRRWFGCRVARWGCCLDASRGQNGLDRCVVGCVGAVEHDPGKVVLDLGVALAVGGDCLADVAVLRAEPGVFGLVAPLALRRGGRPVRRHPITGSTPSTRWRSTWTRRW